MMGKGEIRDAGDETGERTLTRGHQATTRRWRDVVALSVLLAMLVMQAGCQTMGEPRDGFDEGRKAQARGDYDTALREFRTLAEYGDPTAQLALGEMYEKGQGIPQDPNEAAKWYQKAAERGRGTVQAMAKNKLGKPGRTMQAPVDDATAFREAQAPYKQDDYATVVREAEAAYKQGDYATVFNLFRPAAEQGNAKAQYNLGVLFKKGQGVTQDYTEAARWFRKAAEQGHSIAQNKLDEISRKGQVVAKNDVPVVEGYRPAGERVKSSGQDGSRAAADRKDEPVTYEWEVKQLDLGKALGEALQSIPPQLLRSCQEVWKWNQAATSWRMT